MKISEVTDTIKMAKTPKQKLLVFIVAFNAEKHLVSLLDRIPEGLWNSKHYDVEILIIDDASKDATSKTGHTYSLKSQRRLKVLCNPINQGYGGNQKVGYTYAVENNFDIVVLLHGDGQYAPELLEEMVEPIANGKADAVFGSRMMQKKNALKGGMPLYKFVGNMILTKIQNVLLGSKLTEFHSGYRAYKVKALSSIPFSFNSNDFDFDTDIIIQLLDSGCTIAEIPIPTHYGDEECHVNGLKYARQILYSTFISKVQRYGIYYNPKFDYTPQQNAYQSKVTFDSSHSFALDQVKPETTVVDIGCASGYIAKSLQPRKCKVYGIDQYITPEAEAYFKKTRQVDLDQFDFDFQVPVKKIDHVLMLDVIEHLTSPEEFLIKLREKLSNGQTDIVITTGNVAFIIVRFSMLLGSFNYGKRGILDLTHKRLFTFTSLKSILENYGYQIQKNGRHSRSYPIYFRRYRFCTFSNEN
jgi:glycosyltransferase involved in cell wall biosynthesis